MKKLVLSRIAIVFLACIGVAGAASAQIVNTRGTTQPVSAANHCTRYSNTYGQDLPDGCADLTAPNAYNFMTQATAPRDYNFAAVSNSVYVCIWYQWIGPPYPNFEGQACGTSAASYGAVTPNTYAGCDVSVLPSLMNCLTDWHN